jgi:hypothetical protein
VGFFSRALRAGENGATAPFEARLDAQGRTCTAFLDACATGELDRLVSLLAADGMLYGCALSAGSDLV